MFFSMKCIIEDAGSNYSAYLEGLDGVVTTGRTVEEIKTNRVEALEAYKESCMELGAVVPDVRSGDLELVMAEE